MGWLRKSSGSYAQSCISYAQMCMKGFPACSCANEIEGSEAPTPTGLKWHAIKFRGIIRDNHDVPYLVVAGGTTFPRGVT